MKNLFLRFVKEESGQDLIEYTLLLAFVALVSAAVFIQAGTSASGIWVIANQKLSQACSAAGGSSS
jgi:Flp pilus assembly pilin Flp